MLRNSACLSILLTAGVLPAIFYIACGQEPRFSSAGGQPVVSAVHFLDWTVDSVRLFVLPGKYYYYGPGFLFSPVEKDKIWVTPENSGSFELDLQTGSTTPFSQKFGHTFFNKPLRSGGIFEDPIEKKVCWFIQFHGGVFRYDFASRQGQFFDITQSRRSITKILFSQKYVWIGTSNGLWAYERATGRCRVVEHSPDVWVDPLVEDANGKIRIGAYAYDPETRCWEILTPPETPRPPDAGPNIYDALLPRFGGNYAAAEAGNEAWFCNSRYWISNTQGDDTPHLYRPPVATLPHTLLADSDHLYLLGTDSFLIVNKQFLKTKRAADPALWTRWARLRHLTDSLKLHYTDPWQVRADKMVWLQREFAGETDPFIRVCIQSFAQQISISNETELHSMLAQNMLPANAVDAAFGQLIKQRIQQGKWKQAKKLVQEFQTLRHSMPDMPEISLSPNDLTLLDQTLRRLDSLEQSALPEDEQLWHKGLVVQSFCTGTAVFTNEASCYDTGLADSIYRDLVRRFPKSPRADDADYQLIVNNLCYEGEDGSDHPEEVATWKKFLKKYPTTEWRPFALGAMAWALGRSEKALREGLRLYAEAEQLRPDLFDEANPEGRFASAKAEFQRQLDRLELKLSVYLKKSKLQRGKPLELVFELKNTAAETKKLYGVLDPKLPNFAVEVTSEDFLAKCVRPAVFVESTTTRFPPENSAYGNRNIPPGGVYRETWDITRLIGQYRNAIPGRYVIDQPGRYKVNAYYAFDYDREGVSVTVEIE